LIETEKQGGISFKKIINEFWTSKQRQAHSIHEISYRACFKPQLPNFFIQKLTKEGDVVYDPFSGRGTTVLEAAIRGRNIISNDVNPLSRVLVEGRICPPLIKEIEKRLNKINSRDLSSDTDLTMFYHPDTLKEILSLRNYLIERKKSGKQDYIDKWIRMVATNRLTGHSPGFFSVYTLPPNQAVTADRQKKINLKRGQEPTYRNVKSIILNKSIQLQKDLTINERKILNIVSGKIITLEKDARQTPEIGSETVDLVVTSPPFLDVIQYAADNWLRCWFNNIYAEEVTKKISVLKKIGEWEMVMESTLKELFRVVKKNGWVAFEVGEVRNGKIKLEDHIIPLGVRVGFNLVGVIINEQEFTKTSNIWGVNNNSKGTNSNRIVLFNKI